MNMFYITLYDQLRYNDYYILLKIRHNDML